MTNRSISEETIKNLQDLYKERGFITEENILDSVIDNNLSLNDIDRLCEILLSMGFIIRADTIKTSSTKLKIDYEEEVYDRSQIDYEELYKEVVSIDDSLSLFIKGVSRILPPQHREWSNLMPHAKNGNEFARQRILEMYLRTVIRISLWHHKKYDLPLADTIQEGFVGLITALEKYDLIRQENFATYAPWWVRQVIFREMIPGNSLIYFPAHMKDKLFPISEIAKQCEICEGSNCVRICQQVAKEISDRFDCDLEEAEELFNYTRHFDSIEFILELNEENFTDNGMAESEMLDYFNKKELESTVEQILDTLKTKEKEILLMRFGFSNGKPQTLEEIGKVFGVTRERIRQIEKKALKRLKHPSRSKKLKCFYI